MKLKVTDPSVVFETLQTKCEVLKSKEFIDRRFEDYIHILYGTRMINTDELLKGILGEEWFAEREEELWQERKVASKGSVCVWQMGTACDGRVRKEKFFAGQIEIPVCEKHLLEHKVVILANCVSGDVDAIVRLTHQHRLIRLFQSQINALDALKCT